MAEGEQSATVPLTAIDNSSAATIIPCTETVIAPQMPPNTKRAADEVTSQPVTKKLKVEAKAAPQATPGKAVGLVKWFDTAKSFGFITRDTGEDVFVHQSNIASSAPGRKGLADGEQVEFGCEIQNGKMRAMDVCAIGGGPVVGQVDPLAITSYGMEAPPAAIAEHTNTALPPGRYRGKCKWFNVAKGYGFVVPNDGSAEAFVHQSDLKSDRRQQRSLQEDENVEFTLQIEDGGRKRKAVDVTGPGGAFVAGQSLTPVVNNGMSGGYGGAAAYGAYAGTTAAYGAYAGAATQQPAASSMSDQWAAYQAQYAQYAAAAAAAGTPVVPPATMPGAAQASYGAYSQPDYSQQQQSQQAQQQQWPGYAQQQSYPPAPAQGYDAGQYNMPPAQ